MSTSWQWPCPRDATGSQGVVGCGAVLEPQENLPGMMLETQNNNLGACRLYERCGYVMGGVDHLRYRGIDPQTREVAIFWYRLFKV